MSYQHKLVLFVEGQSDCAGVPALVRRILALQGNPAEIFLDPNPFNHCGVDQLCAKKGPNSDAWERRLRAATKNRGSHAILLVADGDKDPRGGLFCPASVSNLLAKRAKVEGAGIIFSVAIVFAVREFESWLIAGLTQGCGLKPGIQIPAELETRQRNAKGWLNQNLQDGYDEILDQGKLTGKIDLQSTELAAMRSFRRLNHAIKLLSDALVNERHVLTPSGDF